MNAFLRQSILFGRISVRWLRLLVVGLLFLGLVRPIIASDELIQFASNLSIREQSAGKYSVTIQDPVRTSQKLHYHLFRQGSPSPEATAHPIKIPADRIVSLSTTYVGSFAALDALDHLVAVDNSDYLFSARSRELYEAGEILEVGRAGNVDLESIIAIQPDLVLLTQINPGQNALVERLEKAGIPVLITAAWRENDPLGRSEWIKLFGILTGEKDRAFEIFDQTADRYQSLKDRVRASEPEKPKVLLSAPFGGTWYMPGGKSFTVQLMADAGAEYLWSSNDSTGSFPVDLEAAFARGFQADFWLNPGGYDSLSEIATADPRFTAFPVFKGDRLFNRTQRVGPTGANDFWESGSVYPDRVLADLVKIFHPSLLPDHSLFYYRQLR